MPARIVVGLGNPGSEYDWTRHNLGFHAVDQVASEGGGLLFKSARKLSETADLRDYRGPMSFEWCHLAPSNGWLIKPMTFMNRSGKVVGPLAQALLHVAVTEIPEGPTDAEASQSIELSEGQGTEPPVLTFDPSRLLVVYDDLDLPLGKLRLRPHGGHGGHNGMRSIIEHLGTNRFPRLRVGIGSPGTDAVRHVLETFPPAQRVEAEISVRESAEAILDWLEHGDFGKCMTRFHSRWNGES